MGATIPAVSVASIKTMSSCFGLTTPGGVRCAGETLAGETLAELGKHVLDSLRAWFPK